MEIEMTGWTIENINIGAQQLFGTPPWRDTIGQCLINRRVFNRALREPS
jgi:hypothetical protein